MKKINSIGYGHIIVILIGIFLVAVPLCAFVLLRITHLATFRVILNLSLAAGGLIAVFLAALLAVELAQDRRIARYHASHRNRALPLSDGRYECQHCGSTAVRRGDKACAVCGIRFE